MKVAFVLSLVFAAALGAQVPPARVATKDWIIERWSNDQGLPQNTVEAIEQTPDGYMWLGTNGGLVRFDGVRFTSFSFRDHPALGSERVVSLRTAPDGTLWIATDRALASYKDGHFRAWGDSAGRPVGRSNRLFVDSSGVWLTTSTGGVGHLPRGGTRFVRYGGVAQNWAGGVLRDRDGNVWVDQRPYGITVLRPGSEHFQPITIEHNGVRATEPFTLAHTGLPIFNTRGKGPSRWTRDSLIPLDVGPGAIARDQRGGYWSSDRHGLWYIDASGHKALLDSAEGRNFRLARVMFVDRENSLWLGTFVSGLVRFRPRVVQTYLRADGLVSDQIAAIHRDSRGRLWIGANCDSTTVMTGATMRKVYPPGCVYGMAETPDGTMWLGVYNGGLRRVTRDGLHERVEGANSRLPTPIVLSLYADKDTSVWIGNEVGLSHYKGGEFHNYFVEEGNAVYFITRDKRGSLWLGTSAGLTRMDSGGVRSWTHRDGLPAGPVRAIYQDADGLYWIGTYGGGLARFDGKRFATIGSAQGLFDDFVSSIHEDSAGNLWMSGNRGIYRAKRADLNAVADGRIAQVRSVGYGPADGLITAETNGGFQPSAWQDKDGRLWFATVRGLATIDPAIAAPRADPPRVVIEKFTVDGKKQPRTGTARLPTGSRYIEIEYTGLTSFAPERVVFQHRLDGFDPDWVYAAERRIAYYSAPRPGRYTFHVTAASREGNWNEVAQSMSFVVPAALYQTVWFRALILLLASGTALAGVRMRIARAHERARLQHEFTRHVLHGQEQERGRLAGELHDSLGQDLLIMKTRAALALRAPDLPEALRPHLAEIASVATQAVQHAREMSHDLRPHHLDNLGLAASLRDLAEHAGKAGDLLIEADVGDGDARVSRDQAIQVFRIVQESLSNIIKHAQATAVTITLHADGPGTRLLISDDGLGIEATRPHGFGLTGINQRVQILGGTFAVRSMAGAGTTIDVFVPPPAPSPPPTPIAEAS